jgi:hypothetical protein
MNMVLPRDVVENLISLNKPISGSILHPDAV